MRAYSALERVLRHWTIKHLRKHPRFVVERFRGAKRKAPFLRRLFVSLQSFPIVGGAVVGIIDDGDNFR